MRQGNILVSATQLLQMGSVAAREYTAYWPFSQEIFLDHDSLYFSFSTLWMTTTTGQNCKVSAIIAMADPAWAELSGLCVKWKTEEFLKPWCELVISAVANTEAHNSHCMTGPEQQALMWNPFLIV